MAIESPRGRAQASQHKALVSVSALCVLAVTAATLLASPGSSERRSPAERRLQNEAQQDTLVCEDAARWEQLPWVHLSYNERTAWGVIGWSENAWDLAHPVLTETGTTPTMPPNTRPEKDSACYQDLNEDEQDAVRLLGYTITSWHVCKNPACPWPTGIPEPNAPCLDRLLYLENKYDFNRSWFGIPPRQREAFVLLGWDAEGVRWANSDKPVTYARRWIDLEQKEVEAATFLGYNQQAWEGCVTSSSCITRLQLFEEKSVNWMWTTMPSAIRQRHEELGWSFETWLEGYVPASYEVRWNDLSHAQSVSARLIGYTRDTWDGCPTAPCFERFSYAQQKYGSISWDRMKLAQQQAWSLLGHTAESWGQGGMVNTRTMQMRWQELTPEQQAQATFLGHSEGTWQGCNTDWESGDAGNHSSMIDDSPIRTVRGRMLIQRPFSEVSGNVYGAAVATLPVSFIDVFERSVARALFCGNTPFSSDPATYVNPDGTPRCKLTDNFQRQAHRIHVVSVREGSIIVDFTIAANQTIDDPTAPELFEALLRQLESDDSPIAQDSEFGIFARAASVEEIPLMNLSPENLTSALVAEERRNIYGPNRACELLSHYEEGQPAIRCPSSSSGASVGARGGGAGLWMMACALVALAARR